MKRFISEKHLLFIDQEFKKYLGHPENMESATTSLVDDLIEDAILSVVLEEDVKRKHPLFQSSILEAESSGQYEIGFTHPHTDIFNNSIADKGEDCSCPNCHRSIFSSVFAPHLAKCMGMGRSTRKVRNAANNNTNKEVGGTSLAASDDEDDADWTMLGDKKNKRRKEKSTVKKVKSSSKSSRNGSDAGSNISYDGMSERDRRVFLSQICGVVSEHTKKVCTKTIKCPQHTDEQKKYVRDLYLDNFESSLENLQVEVDVEDDGEMTKESLTRSWEAENSNTSSPADSASTSSSSSKKRDKTIFKSKNKDQ